MSDTWFHASTYGTPQIKPVQVARATEHKVVVIEQWFGRAPVERKRDKTAAAEIFRPTWEECHAWLLDNAEARVKSMRLQLGAANGRLGNIKGMRKP